eukprot:TRINITY_DN7117_c0_g1_i4.p1 TRINITY_DN7117_c0_g1~~TRINITY_DN7117_c0_g1_i4.p1  ORF type:complete len:468 (-),score=161.24 TRINITY_DN7117_c0_g1_i4:22-1425(-)
MAKIEDPKSFDKELPPLSPPTSPKAKERELVDSRDLQELLQKHDLSRDVIDRITQNVTYSSFGQKTRDELQALVGEDRQSLRALLRLKRVLEWNVQPELILTEITVDRPLGGGHQADIFVGKWKNHTTVVLKKFKSEDQAKLFWREIQFLRESNHPNILRILGVFIEFSENDEEGYYQVMERLKESLDNKKILNQQRLIDVAQKIACGMDYLVSKHIVHKDLAARNVLLDFGGDVKIADFGMAQYVKDDKEYPRHRTGAIPIFWTAPESLREDNPVVSHKSDVWSYGVVLWELVTGKFPFKGMFGSDLSSKKQLCRFLDANQRLVIPEEDGHVPAVIREIMNQCWKMDPAERPTFQEIADKLSRHTTKSFITLPDLPILPRLPNSSQIQENEVNDFQRPIPIPFFSGISHNSPDRDKGYQDDPQVESVIQVESVDQVEENGEGIKRMNFLRRSEDMNDDGTHDYGSD